MRRTCRTANHELPVAERFVCLPFRCVPSRFPIRAPPCYPSCVSNCSIHLVAELRLVGFRRSNSGSCRFISADAFQHTLLSGPISDRGTHSAARAVVARSARALGASAAAAAVGACQLPCRILLHILRFLMRLRDVPCSRDGAGPTTYQGFMVTWSEGGYGQALVAATFASERVCFSFSRLAIPREDKEDSPPSAAPALYSFPPSPYHRPASAG